MMIIDYLKQIRDVFSVRNARRGLSYKPDSMSERLRNRILMLYVDVLTGRMESFNSFPENHLEEFWTQMHQNMRHLYGRPKLSQRQVNNPVEDAAAFIERCTAPEFCDFIELSFKVPVAWRAIRENELVEALNEILRTEDAPYQLTPGVQRTEEIPEEQNRIRGGRRIIRVAFPRVVRMDEEIAHTEAVLPALCVLAYPAYAGANDEFRKALEDYRKGDFEDCLVKCGSAFESVLKVLCDKNGLTYTSKDTANRLIDVVLPASSLDPGIFKESFLTIAKIRNRLSTAHGGGSTVRSVPRHVAQYSVTSTAAAIVLLVHEMGS